MAALKPTRFTARVLWLGLVRDRGAALASAPVERITCRFDGVAGEDHGGATRASCSRVLDLHPRGTEIRNTRQLSLVSAEDLAATAAAMGLEWLDPAWLGATLLLEGIPDFTHVPPSSRLQAPSGATLVVDMENRPCQLPAPVIERHHPGLGKGFKSAARGRRGVTAWVEREGPIALGDSLRLHVPDQPAWPHLDAARQS
ncbi:MOSC domain-containing protein [Frigidibacter sp. ROC022]|uniref:MOSC domain-containing protein n=1 Tax=Frigidibacter sp. ROC022 TaxID=2971796 RepID=UPI00215A6C63|nr:sulfurase [Frigidibacter sp. ROC022]MCR8723261.1 sulfurase [Frigidibacter sp. ROC022]